MVPTSSGYLDDFWSMFGKVRFRCTKCNHRMFERVWPSTETRYAHCPHCFSAHLQRWSPVFLAPSLRASLWRRLGARSYRCLDCSHAFASFRPARPSDRKSQTLADTSDSPPMDLPTAMENRANQQNSATSQPPREYSR